MDTQYEKKYNELMACLRQMHDNNVRRMKMALRSLLIVPTIFLVMLFFTNSSKTIFLVLWIVSMFIIAAILIVIEYQDYTLRKNDNTGRTKRQRTAEDRRKRRRLRSESRGDTRVNTQPLAGKRR